MDGDPQGHGLLACWRRPPLDDLAMKRMPVDGAGGPARPWRCACEAGELRSRRGCCIGVAAAALVSVACVAAATRPSGPPAPPSPPSPALHFGVAAAPCNAADPAQRLATARQTTHPHTEPIFVGGLPGSTARAGVLAPCVARGSPGCCLSAGVWSEKWGAHLATIAPCRKGDHLQLWSRSGGSVTSSDGPQLCLDSQNLCLSHQDGAPILVGPRRSPHQSEQQWELTDHSVGWGRTCLQAQPP